MLERANRGSSATASNAANPAAKSSRKPIASARFARATGESVRSITRSYAVQIVPQSVLCQSGEVACTAAITACGR